MAALAEQEMQHSGGGDDEERLKSKGRSMKEGVSQKHEELWERDLYASQIIASVREKKGTQQSVRQSYLL